MNRLIEFVIRH